jgi:S-DNA-T family DNA segregation ATPase FtsK/SpoIIIE
VAIRFRERRARRRDEEDDGRRVDELVEAWRYACIGAGLSRVAYAGAGPTDSTPKVVYVVLGPPTILTVQLLPAQVAGDFRAVADRLAGPFGAEAVRIRPDGPQHIRVELLDGDPLEKPVTATPDLVRSVHEPLTVGWDEHGDPIAITLTAPDAAHLMVQGASGSGKSTGAYGLFRQLARPRDVRVIGSDITAKLLDPWATRPDGKGWCALGTSYPEGHVNVLEMAVRDMDQRIARIPRRADNLPITDADPLMLFLIEELPGLMRLLQSTGDKKLVQRAETALARLYGESRKAGYRLCIFSQRADADIVGGYNRDQASHAISFRVRSAAALKMLHNDIEAATADRHSTAPAGVALLSAPGVPLVRLRTPYTSYAAYCDAVEAGAP